MTNVNFDDSKAHACFERALTALQKRPAAAGVVWVRPAERNHEVRFRQINPAAKMIIFHTNNEKLVGIAWGLSTHQIWSTLPETNSEFTPEKWLLEGDDRFPFRA